MTRTSARRSASGACTRVRSSNCRCSVRPTCATARDGSWTSSPTRRHYLSNPYQSYGLYGLYLIDLRTGLLPLDDTLKTTFDPYVFVRDAYLQHRAYLISDGKIKDEEPLVDPDADLPEPAR